MSDLLLLQHNIRFLSAMPSIRIQLVQIHALFQVG